MGAEDFGDTHWRSAGERIEALFEACAADGPAAQDRAERLVREVVDLYGAALTRVMDLADDPVLAGRLAADDLIGSLLLVTGAHPHDVTERVSRALEAVRPYLGSHGGDVELIDITDGVVRLAFAGSCRSCPSSAATLELAVREAICTAAPEIVRVEAVTVEPSSVIPVDSLLSRVRAESRDPTTWCAAPELGTLAPGEVAGFTAADVAVLACRVDDTVLVYHDQCPQCAGPMAGASLSGTMLRCPRCHARFDAVHAGTGIGGTVGHLRPVPVLVRDGMLCMAIPDHAMEASA